MKNILLIIAFIGLSNLSSAQTESDIQTVIQMSINIDELQPYYHPEQENRKPLRIEDNGVISSNLKLEKFDEPVQFMKQADLFFNNVTAFLVFDKVEINATTATVLFHYDVEGIKIMLSLQKIDRDWKIIKNSLTEE